MRTEKYLFHLGNGMAAFLDFGVGVLIGALTALSSEHQLSWRGLFLTGVLALLPDLQIVIDLLRTGKRESS